jgi:hypothetical protein
VLLDTRRHARPYRVERAAIAARITAEADMRGQPLAKEILAKYAARFDEMADARHVAGDVAGFERWARLACATAKDLAPYQSPTYRAVVIAPPPDKTLEDDVVINLKIFDDTGTALEVATRRAKEEQDREPKGNEMLEKPQPVRNLVVR